MTVIQAYEYLYNELKHLGCIKWHNNRVSYYLKFKDCRIGSIRLSNHGSRKIYKYTFDYIQANGKYKKKQLDKIIDDIHMKVINLKEFNPNICLVYKNGKYIEIKENIYRSTILGVM